VDVDNQPRLGEPCVWGSGLAGIGGMRNGSVGKRGWVWVILRREKRAVVNNVKSLFANHAWFQKVDTIRDFPISAIESGSNTRFIEVSSGTLSNFLDIQMSDTL
jgi:hypothetical protein